ncbi:DUF4430 domain-containing protein [Paenibacillus psychroresistens]|uniref:DUF4430 domain-containing protein n=1 Tax=Paenibacillus psychroresistens TaxID=1778678 RepID=A0A6B8RKP7_9BACL|nr:DUF4430 domain-containing protein [Paenibacillus psychroresistens]QGQ95928.1 DUF4430 domain-containing protein [Paenibacillus psychroresistens]
MSKFGIIKSVLQLLLVFTMMISMAACGDEKTADLISAPIQSAMISSSPLPTDLSKPEQSPIENSPKVSEQSPSTIATATESPAPVSTTAAPISSGPASLAPTSAPTPSASEKGILLSITGDDKLGVILESTLVEVEGEVSVITLLQKQTRKEKIQMESSGKGIFAYVKGIANLYEFDRGAKSGWLFKVNGVFSDKGAGSHKVKAGDQVEWLYTLDLGKDIGAKR